jgi:hypothetical protein
MPETPAFSYCYDPGGKNSSVTPGCIIGHAIQSAVRELKALHEYRPKLLRKTAFAGLM